MVNDLSNLHLEPGYDSGKDDIVNDFYVPVLSKANQYDRIAGFFSSSALAVAAKGMEEFISNGGTMRLVTCPRLSNDDIKAMIDSTQTFDNILLKNFISSYEEIEDKFMLDHVRALGWMLANKLLEIKIAVVKNGSKYCTEEEIVRSGIMHQKVGILYDQVGNVLSFSGSNNESGSGWAGNIEEFKVFCSWNGAMPWIEGDIAKFNSFWDGRRQDVDIKDLPIAIKEKLIEEGKGFKPEYIRPKKKSEQQEYKAKPKEKLELFYYQKEAVAEWDANGRSLLLQMATGTGKTRTAIGCITKALTDTKKLLVVIACPQVTLSAQWKRDIENLDVNITNSVVINGNISHWSDLLNKELLKLRVGSYKHLIVYTTHKTSSSVKFLDVIKSAKFEKIPKFLVGDEVHDMGAGVTRNALSDCYSYRLGLSATPQRWYDDNGTKIIEDYFGNKSYEFSLWDALLKENPATGKTFLVHYTYMPCFVTMTDEELAEYKKLTLQIIRSSRADSDDDYVQRLRDKRADVGKNAEEKYYELERILDSFDGNISNTIIFVSDEQIDKVLMMLGRRGIPAIRFTQDQGTTPMSKYGGLSERDYIINRFRKGDYKVLVAIKCLDEGIDIPSADTAIIMASSTNPREYVQRIGRIIRQAPGKYDATIYDMILRPDLDRFDDDKLREMEKYIFEKELVRVEDLSRCAKNSIFVLKQVYDVKEETLRNDF